jgi:hypothetical protein
MPTVLSIYSMLADLLSLLRYRCALDAGSHALYILGWAAYILKI